MSASLVHKNVIVLNLYYYNLDFLITTGKVKKKTLKNMSLRPYYLGIGVGVTYF